MFFLRAIFWVAVISIILPDGFLDNIYRSAKSTALGSEMAEDADPYMEHLVEEETGFCEDFVVACSAVASVKDFAHIQAIRVTGSLHEWLMDTYEPPDNPFSESLAVNDADEG